MNPEIRSTQVDIAGLLEVLGKGLYSTPVVVVRELLQNAHDACVRRRVESGWTGDPDVRILVDPVKRTLTFQDNGAGLTRQEIVDYLATIGTGYTRLLRQRTSDTNAVGYFGLGFLSAYVVADEVEFLTTSCTNESTTTRFASTDGQRYVLDRIPRRAVGSHVVLHLKPAFAHLADHELLRRVVRKYCGLLPINIRIADDEVPANRLDVPWRMAASGHSELRIKKAALEFVGVFDRTFQPIMTIPLPGNDETPIRGLLWIQDGSFHASSDNRVTTIFIRSMHVTDECRDLLPDWAGFVGCVVDGANLTPTASRESVKDDEEFGKVKAYIKRVLIEALVATSKRRGPEWRRIQSRHNQSLLGAAVSDDSLFEAMHQDLALPTSEGELTVGDICQRGGSRQLRLAMEESGGYEHLIARSMGIPIVHGYRFAVASFCRELSQRGGYSLITLGSRDDNAALFPDVEIEAGERAVLTQYFTLADAHLVITRFEPACLPVVKVLDRDAVLKKRIEADELDRHLGSATLMLARRFTDALEIEHEAYLYVNYANPVIREFGRLGDTRKSLVSGLLLATMDLLMTKGSDSRSGISMMEDFSRNLLLLGRGTD